MRIYASQSNRAILHRLHVYVCM